MPVGEVISQAIKRYVRLRNSKEHISTWPSKDDFNVGVHSGNVRMERQRVTKENLTCVMSGLTALVVAAKGAPK